MLRLITVAATAALALSVALPAAAAAPGTRRLQPQAGTADLPSPAQRRASVLRAVHAKAPTASAPTVADVGDVDSFGRSLTWLGVTQGDIALTDDCSAWSGYACQLLSTSPDKATSFSFNDVGHVVLPPKATHSLLCYWLSPYFDYSAGNPTASPVVASLRLSPTLTIENTLLDDPALVDPQTGLPFGGRLTTSMTSSERIEVPLPAGVSVSQRQRDSHVCIAGFLSRRTLVEIYGLTGAQADEFFKRQTTVRLNVSGSSRYIDQASLVYGLRIIGD